MRLTRGLLQAIFTVCLLGFLLPAQAQDPKLTNISNPMDTNVSVGATVSLRVYASSMNPPMTYQWQQEGTNLPGATTSLLSLANVTVANAGRYVAWMTNAGGGFTNSRTATLTVDPTFIKITQGPLVEDVISSWWGGNWADIDGDSLLDVNVSGWDSASGLNFQLYRNLGDGMFSRAYTVLPQVIWADLDNDGDLDGWNGGAFTSVDAYVNDGHGNFTRLDGPRLIGNQNWPGGNVLCFCDYDADGLVDLVVQGADSNWNQNKIDYLVRNLGDWSFEIVTNTAWSKVGTVEEVGSWVDLNQDGLVDLVTIGQPSRLLLNRGGGTFEEVFGDPFVAKSNAYQGGVTPVDFDNDGDFDLLVGRWGQFREVYQNDGTGRFTKIALPPITTMPVDGSLSMDGHSWGDFDNDGDLDLCLGAYGQRNRLFANNGDGTFTEIFPGSPVNDVAHTLTTYWVDVDNDGFLDLFAANGAAYGAEKNLLYRNNLKNAGNTNHWLKVKLIGTASNRDGIGATVRTLSAIGGNTVQQTRLIGSGMVTTDLIAHFGLGDAANVTTLRIEWPSGIVQELPNVAANQFLTVVESQNYTNTPPAFASAIKDGGGLQLSITEPDADARYVLEASTDLITWTKLLARTSTGGTCQFTDTHSADYPQRFYRLQVP